MAVRFAYDNTLGITEEEPSDSPNLLSDTDDEREGVELLSVGIPFDYTVPNFPVIRCKLRQIMFRAELPNGITNTYDGFVRDDASLGVRSCPALIHVKDYCFVQVDIFCKGAPANHLNHPQEGIYLVWSWEWMSLLSHIPKSYTSCSNTSDQEAEEEEPNDNSENEHTVLFKCIGATRDRRQQSSLEKANELLRMNKNVQVGLFPEPTNPVDAKAIAIKCQLEGDSWCRIGYIVREVLDEVHAALQQNAITNVGFGWVKYRINYYRSGPGFYAAIATTSKGYWSTIVRNSGSK